MTDWTTARVTPELRAELKRLLDEATPRPWEAYRPHPHYRQYAVDAVTPDGHLGYAVATTQDVQAEANAELIATAVNALPALLDAAAERDRLARLLDEPRRSGCAVEIAGVRIAPCDERGQTADMRERDTLADRLAHMTEARDNARAEVERLTALVEAVREYAAARQANIDHGPLLSTRKAAHDALLAALARLDEEPQP